MSNILEDSMIETIKELGRRGWSIRRIAKKLKVNRRTVSKYLAQDSKCTISTTGNNEGEEPKCTISTAGRRSKCVLYDEYILERMKLGLSAQRIFQDLQSDRGFEGGYESVKRYVRKLQECDEIPFRRMEVLPGTECQVDYGTGAWIVGEDGKRRKTHLFRVVLSCSRKAYSEVSFTQETECFLRALENAFRHFGGVPETVVIDNLKAGVIKPCVYDPELNPKLRDFAAHYGTCILPSRVRTPRHKGKVERQVGYAQDNALKGRSFKSLAEQNAHLRDWEINVADKRIHGTTRRQVQQMFNEEKPHLGVLPPDLFPAFQEGRRKVHRDGHVEVARAYYSVPPEYTRREVWVRHDGRLVQIFNNAMERLCVHAHKEPGQRSTRREHIPPEKISNPELGNEWMLRKAWNIGDGAHAWAKAMLAERGVPGTRVLNGLLSMRKKHPCSAINIGCAQALEAQEFSLKGLKRHIESRSIEQQSFAFIEDHPLIRATSEYEQITNSKGLFQ
ncbi:MAG: IS21 family transposase [Verrucomicrobiota bacterium]